MVLLLPDCFASRLFEIRAKDGLRILHILNCDWTAVEIISAYQVFQVSC